MTLALLLTVFAASLLGSLHCAGMCGPFVAVYSAAGGGAGRERKAGTGQALPVADQPVRRWRSLLAPHFAYHGGRGVTYVSLGAAAGLLGASLDWVGRSAGLIRVAALVSGVLVMLWGLGVLVPRLPIKSPLQNFLGRRLVRLRRKPAVTQATLLGAFTPMLPCGWLYAFVVMSAGAGGPWGGAALMAAFWLGTIPALLGMGLVAGRLGRTLRARMPVITGVSLIVLGLFTIVARTAQPLPIPSLVPGTPDGADSAAAMEVPDGEHQCH